MNGDDDDKGLNYVMMMQVIIDSNNNWLLSHRLAHTERVHPCGYLRQKNGIAVYTDESRDILSNLIY